MNLVLISLLVRHLVVSAKGSHCPLLRQAISRSPRKRCPRSQLKRQLDPTRFPFEQRYMKLRRRSVGQVTEYQAQIKVKSFGMQ